MLGDCVGIRPFLSNLNALGELRDQREVCDGCLINDSYLVKHEETAQKHSKRENLHIVILVFVHTPQTLRVHNVDIEDSPILLDGHRFTVQPKTSGAGIHRGINLECIIMTDNLIHEKTLSCPIFARDA